MNSIFFASWSIISIRNEIWKDDARRSIGTTYLQGNCQFLKNKQCNLSKWTLIPDLVITTFRLTINFLQSILWTSNSRAIQDILLFFRRVLGWDVRGGILILVMKRIILDAYGKLEQHRMAVKKNILHWYAWRWGSCFC